MFENFFGSPRRKKVGLALGGGVARGIAHIGVLKVLDKHDIPIDYMAGTSTGSLVAALYAGGISPYKFEHIALRTGWSNLVKLTFSTHGPLSAEGIRRFVENRIGKDTTFKDLLIPLKIVCTDLLTGKPYIFDSGNVANAVQASCTFPGIFKPVVYEGLFLVDGGISNNVPSAIVKEMGADFIISVDAVPKLELLEHPQNVVEVIGRAVDIMLRKLSEEGRNSADILIEPEFDEDDWHFDLSKADHLIQAGEIAAEKALQEIERKIK
jgi:NTE family protein